MNRLYIILIILFPVLILMLFSCSNSPTGLSEYSTEFKELRISVEWDEMEVSNLEQLSGTLRITNLTAKERLLGFSDPCMFRYAFLQDGNIVESISFPCIGITHGIRIEPFGTHSQDLMSMGYLMDALEKGTYQLLTYINLVKIDEEFTGQETFNHPVGKHNIIVN